MARTLRTDLRAIASRAGDAVPGWVGGAMAGLQAALLSAGAVVAVALAAAAASPPADGTAGVDWESAALTGVRVWLLAHGVPAGSGGASVGLVPLGLSAVFASLAAGLARRFAVPTTGSWLAFTATYAGCAAAVASATDSALVSPHAVARAAVVAAIVGGGGAAAGLRRAGWLKGGRRSLPAALGSGVRLGAAASLGIVGAGAITFIAWTVAAWSDIASVAGSLDADPVGALALAIGEGMYAPTLAVWGAAWLAGPGFSVGAGTEYAPGHLDTGLLPSVPLLAALPRAAGGILVLAPLVIVAIGATARSLARRLETPVGTAAQVIAAFTVAILAGLGSVASRGALGGGRLASVGPPAIEVALWTGALAAAGFAIASLAPRWIAMRMRTRAQARGSNASRGSTDAPSPPPGRPPGTRSSPRA